MLPHIPDATDIVAVTLLLLLIGGGAAAWGIGRYQSEGSWAGAAIGVLGLLLALYAPLSAVFGWPPVDWLRG